MTEDDTEADHIIVNVIVIAATADDHLHHQAALHLTTNQNIEPNPKDDTTHHQAHLEHLIKTVTIKIPLNKKNLIIH